MELEPENIVLTALKKAEDDDALILRFCEWAGKATDVTIKLPSGAESAQDADLVERPLAELSIQAGVARVHTKPYEIKSVKFRFTLPPILQPVEIAK